MKAAAKYMLSSKPTTATADNVARSGSGTMDEASTCGTGWLRHNDEASKASCSHDKIRIFRACSIQVLCLVGKINLKACMLETKRRSQLFMNGNGRQALLKQSLKHLPFCTSRGAFSLAFCVSYEELSVRTPMKFL